MLDCSQRFLKSIQVQMAGMFLLQKNKSMVLCYGLFLSLFFLGSNQVSAAEFEVNEVIDQLSILQNQLDNQTLNEREIKNIRETQRTTTTKKVRGGCATVSGRCPTPNPTTHHPTPQTHTHPPPPTPPNLFFFFFFFFVPIFF